MVLYDPRRYCSWAYRATAAVNNSTTLIETNDGRFQRSTMQSLWSSALGLLELRPDTYARSPPMGCLSLSQYSLRNLGWHSASRGFFILKPRPLSGGTATRKESNLTKTKKTKNNQPRPLPCTDTGNMERFIRDHRHVIKSGGHDRHGTSGRANSGNHSLETRLSTLH